MIKEQLIREDFDYNIVILRPILCFGVICNHFNSPFMKFPLFLTSCVPIFFIISFYLLNMSYINGGGIKTFPKRLVRLIIPMVAWAVIYFLSINTLSLVVHGELKLTFKDLIFQIVGGHCYNTALWFFHDLLIITSIYYLVRKLTNKFAFVCIIFCAIAIISMILEYSGLNYKSFSHWSYIFKYTLGRICEMFPYAFAGLMLQYLFKVKKHIQLIISILLLITGVIVYFKGTRPDGFGYQGLYLVLLSVSFFILFHLINFNRLSTKLFRWINYFSQYTLGIYCLHLLMGQILYTLFPVNYYVFCFIIYGLCFIFFDLITRFIEIKYLMMIYK